MFGIPEMEKFNNEWVDCKWFIRKWPLEFLGSN